LTKQNSHVPAQRQDRRPAVGERIHAKYRKPHAGVSERRRDDDAGEAEAGREVAHEQLQQRAKGKVADDQQRSGDYHHEQIAFERDPEPSLQDQGLRQHDKEEDHEQRRKLPRERHDRISARACEPITHAAAIKLGSHRIAGRERDDHVDDHRQKGAQQELGVVFLRVHQHDRLRHQ